MKRQPVTTWIRKYCLSIEGEYRIPNTCIVALKGGMHENIFLFTPYEWLSASRKTLVKLKVRAKKLLEKGDTALQVTKTVTANAAKPQILRELFKV